MSVDIGVVLCIGSEANTPAANLVEKILYNKYGIENVTLLVSDPSTSGFRHSATAGAAEVWVSWRDGSNSTMMLDSPHPIVFVDAAADANDIAWTVAKWCSLGNEAIREKVKVASNERRQTRFVMDAQLKTKSLRYQRAISKNHDLGLCITESGAPNAISGKVRDRIDVNDKLLALVTTDRQSGFDRQLALIPFKGAVLNLTSAFWFEKTRSIIKNHVVAVPHPYVTISKKCSPFPIEFVVRSYMTGSTSTSIWKNYQDGVRKYCGHDLPDGMTKNQKLLKNILTPTTKEEEHDRPISAEEIIEEEWMSREDWEICSQAAIQIFELGQAVAAERGLILVDTKYEFGRDLETGEILLIDEVHTPDSSRYWLASTYEDRIAKGQEPENIDKEFLRLWFRDHCDPYNDEVLPVPPRDLVIELSRRYITLFEMITGENFRFDVNGDSNILTSIKQYK